jgi:hypothetical protein
MRSLRLRERKRPASCMVRTPDPLKDHLKVPLDHLTRLPRGQKLHRVHRDIYSPVAGVVKFNGSPDGNARFSPIRDPAGNIIPTIYAGTTYECALMESVFHDVPLTAGPTSFDPDALNPMVCSVIEAAQDLLVIDLTTIGLRFFRLKNTDLIDTPAADYSSTRAWAEILYRENIDAQGLYWTSRQDNRAQAIMLFGTRVDPGASLTPVGIPTRLREADGTIELALMRLATKIDVDIAK